MLTFLFVGWLILWHLILTTKNASNGLTELEVRYPENKSKNYNIELPEDSYGIFNVRTGIRMLTEQLDVAFWSRNLFDEDYLAVHYDPPLQSGKLNAYPTEPRTFGVSVNKQF